MIILLPLLTAEIVPCTICRIAAGLYFLPGVLLPALFQRYVPADKFAALFGEANEGFGVLMAEAIGIPLYVCGGGTIPLIREWLARGMSMGSAPSSMRIVRRNL